MKKWLSAIVLLVMLSQALPFNALAAIGHELTAEELAAAYTLTGLGLEEVRVRSNAAYHKGMRPNATWNAMQVSDWLDDVLSTELFNVEDMLSRAGVAMARLKQSNPDAYDRLSGGDSRYESVFASVQKMYCDAEALREQMRYYRDSLQERAALISEMGRQLKEQGGGMFSSERVRLSAKIETAAADLDSLRKEVAGKAEEWTSAIDEWTGRLDVMTVGAGEEERPTWFEELYSYDGEGVKSTAQVVAVDASNSRLGKLSFGKSPLASNDKNADTYVLSENQIAIGLYTGKDGKTPVPGIDVAISDVRDDYLVPIHRTTDENGRIILQSNLFVADDNKKVRVRLEVDGEAQGYRSFCIENCPIKMGEEYKAVLIPMDGTGRPYIYSASFHGYDILYQDFEMLYSHLNDYDFEIKVQTKNPGNNDLTPAPKFGYWKKDESEILGWEYISSWKYKKHLVEATSHEGNTYVFKGPWKKDLVPWVGKEQAPYLTFDSDDKK